MYRSDGPGGDSGVPGGGSGGPGGGSGEPRSTAAQARGAVAFLDLQTARFRTPGELQTRDLMGNHRLDVLYLPIGVLDLENE